jgi:hypothetical protein
MRTMTKSFVLASRALSCSGTVVNLATAAAAAAPFPFAAFLLAPVSPPFAATGPLAAFGFLTLLLALPFSTGAFPIDSAGLLGLGAAAGEEPVAATFLDGGKEDLRTVGVVCADPANCNPKLNCAAEFSVEKFGLCKKWELLHVSRNLACHACS